MNNHIICPKCNEQIPLNEALTHEISEKYRRQASEYLKKKDEEFRKKFESEKERVMREAQLLRKELEEKTRKRVEEELNLKLTDQKNESEELRKQNKALQEQLLETNKLLRQIKQESELTKIDLEKKLLSEQERIRIEEKKRIDEEYRFKMSEQEKKLTDALRVNDELKRKLEQGSQQTQGEVLELEVENALKQEFPLDEIKPVAKGVRGGDIVQVVRNNTGKACGAIIWETKRTKSWSNEWVSKLKDDQRSLHAEMAVIISDVLPNEVRNFGWRNGVWVSNFGCFLGIAHALRKNLLDIAYVRQAQDGKSEKMELLYNYISGVEFRQRIEAIMEGFTSLQNNMEREKRYFAAKWAKEEKDIRKVFDNTLGLSGELQSITGKELPEFHGAELLPQETGSSSAQGSLYEEN